MSIILCAIQCILVAYLFYTFQFQFSCSLVSGSLLPHGLQHTRLPCPSLSPRVFSNSCPLSRWRHPTIPFSVICFSSCPQYFPASVKSESCSVVSDSLRPHGLYSPWNSPGQNTGVGSLSFLQGILPTHRSNLGLPHCRRILYQLSHKGEDKKILSGFNTIL